MTDPAPAQSGLILMMTTVIEPREPSVQINDDSIYSSIKTT